MDKDALNATNPADKHGVGLWIQLDTDTWHRSVEFNGHRHDLACGTSFCVGSDEPLQNLHRDLSIRPQPGQLCRDCLAFWEDNHGE